MKRCCFLGLICSAGHWTLVRLPFPTDSHETTSPSVVQVSVDVHAVHPIGHTSVQVECQRVSLVLCWTGVHSILCVVA